MSHVIRLSVRGAKLLKEKGFSVIAWKCPLLPHYPLETEMFLRHVRRRMVKEDYVFTQACTLCSHDDDTLKPSNLKNAMNHRGGDPRRQYNTTVLSLVRRHVTIELAVMIAELAFGARVRARRHWNAVRRGLLAFTVFNMLKECFLTAD